MKGGYLLPKGRKTWRVWVPWNGKKVFVNRYVDGSSLYHERQCLRVLEKINAEIDAGRFDPVTWGKNKALIFETAWEIYQDQKPCGQARHEQREMIKDNYLLPHFKNKVISEVLTANIQDWYGKINKMGLSPAYLRLIVVTLKGFFSFHSDSLDRMPKFPTVEVPRKKRHVLIPEEQERVHEFIPPDHLPIFKLLHLTGCRPSEACNLKKSDIDWKKMEFTFTDTKIRAFNSLPITSEVAECFKASRPVEHYLYAFSTLNGRKYSRQILYRIWSEANKKASAKYGVPIVSNYRGNRHSKASHLAEMNIPAIDIARLLGNTARTVERSYIEQTTDKLKSLIGSQTVHGSPNL